MSDAAGAGQGAALPPPLRTGMFDSIGGFIRDFPYALFLSAIFSFVLVVIVGLLIAFAQYQSRLLRAQPMLSAPDVVQFVATSKRLEQRFAELDILASEIAELSPEYYSTYAEIEFRTKRVCALFSDNPQRLKTCRDYLRSIPFAEARTTNSAVAELQAEPERRPVKSAWYWPFANNANNRPDVSEVRMLPNTFASIKKRFIDVMFGAERRPANAALEELVELYTWDIEQIAKKNLKYWLKLKGPYCDKNAQYQATCFDVIKLAQSLKAYRNVDVNLCYGVVSQPQDFSQPNCAIPPSDPVVNPRQSDIANATSLAPDAPTTTGQGGQTAADTTAPGANAPQVVADRGEYSGDRIIADADHANDPGKARDAAAPDRQTIFELVTNYQFYDGLFFGIARDLLLSPSDFLALTLACSAGMLGALLRMVFFTYVSGRDPNFRNLFIGPILGLICALVVYILFRAGFIVITDRGQSSDSATLSPFVIAIMSLSAGLLSERAIDLFRRTSGTWLGSAEASQSSRWAVRLKEVLEARGLTFDKLAERLEVSTAKLEDWAAEREMVPIEKQRDIALVLDIPIRLLFTDLPPPSGQNA